MLDVHTCMHVLSFSKLAIGYMGICSEDFQLASCLAQTSFFQLCGFLFAFVGWCLCISATALGQWRQWHIENTTELQSGVIWVGIWDVCSDIHVDGADYYDMNCKPFEEGYLYLPKEIIIAQDLMSLCAVLESLALGVFFFAYWNIIKKESKRRVTSLFFTIGGFLSLISGIVTLIPITWNMLSVLNNENIYFPQSFAIPSHPKDQNVGVAIHLGFVSAILQIVSGLIFICNKYWLIHNKTQPLDFEIPNGKNSEYCPRCDSLNISPSDYYKSFDEGNLDKKEHAKPEETFQIPMGPIPEQKV